MQLRGVVESLCLTNDLGDKTRLNRRGFLKASAAGVVVASGITAPPALAKNRQERCLNFYCPNTGETMRVVYWTPSDGYIEESIGEISYALRDRHNDLVKRIDPKLLDQMFQLQTHLGPRQPMQVLSGYRSRTTNERMRRKSRGVAKESYHMRGMAADIRMKDRNYRDLVRAAMKLKAGGVGRYSGSRFLHIDSGPVRTWGR